MENFIVSARKYRPLTFDTVVGQKSITTTLKNAIKNNHLAQAFLFTGPRGIGKTTCARIFAKTINCSNMGENIDPCNECESCVSFNKNASFNIHELDAASNNSVDDIRNLVDAVRIPPQVGKYKVYIIDEVHMLSSSAFNAFLKTLEEPPAYAKFILATTERHKIIPTILSRCQIYDFQRITVEDIAHHLAFVAEKEHVAFDPDALHIIAQKADGALRDALSIFDQIVNFTESSITYESVIQNLHVLDYDYYFQITDFVLNGDITSSFLLINEIIDLGFDGSHFISGFAEHLRDLLVCKDKRSSQLLEVGKNIKLKYTDQSEICSLHFLIKALDIVNKVEVNYKSSNNKRLQLELMLLNICGLSNNIFQNGIETTKKTENQPKSVPKLPLPVAQSSPPPITLSEPVISQMKQEELKEKSEENIYKPANENKLSAATDLLNQSSTISIRDTAHPLSNGGPAAEPESNYDTEQKQIDIKELNAAIKRYISLIEDEIPTFALSLDKSEPEIKENNVVIITLENKVLDDREQLYKLSTYLRDELETFVNIETRYSQNSQSAKAFTPTEKYKNMAEKNPAISTFKDQLDLEIEF